MKSLLLPLITLAALCSPCWGQTITLPEKVEGGVSAFISVAATTDGETVKWKALDAGLNVFPADLLKSTKTTVVSAPKAGRYRLMAYTAKDNAPSDPAETIIVVGTPGPDPPDPPGPDPPTPDLTGVAKLVFGWAKSVGNKAEAKQIAENYATINAAIGAGAYYNISTWEEQRSKIVADLYDKNRVVSQKNEKWGQFFLSLSGEMKRLDSEGKLTKLSELHEVLKSIQEGLEAASE